MIYQMPVIWYAHFVIYVIEKWGYTIKNLISLLAAIIIFMIIPEGPAALPGFILLIALDSISVVILIAGPSTRGSSLRFEGIPHLTAFDNETAKL